MARLIGTEEIEVLKDIESLNMFSSPEAKRAFRLQVCGRVGCEMYSEISEDQFETCFEYARELLRARGRSILRGGNTIFDR